MIPDALAGLTTSAVVIPQAMAYATIAGLPIQTGLYASAIPMAMYAVLGTSTVLSVSVTSSVSALMAVVIASAPDPAAAAAVVALLVGAILLAAGLLRLGYLADLFSAPVLAGFKVGVGMTIAVGQLDQVLGVSIESSGFLAQIGELVKAVPDAHGPTVLLSIVSLAALALLPAVAPRIPAPLVIAGGGIIVVGLFDLSARSVALVEKIPTGLPLPSLPTLEGFSDLVVPAAGIALLVVVESLAAARAFRDSSEPAIDADREMAALGIANLAAGMVQAYAVGGGLSQTAVNRRAGARSPAAGVFTAAVVVLTLLVLAPIFGNLAQATLGVLVLGAAYGLVDFTAIRTMLTVRRVDGLLALGAMLGVVFLGVLPGVLLGIAGSMVIVLAQLNRRRVQVLDRVPIVSGDQPVPEGLVIARPDGGLYFANIETVCTRIRELASADSSPKVIVLDAVSVPAVEFSAMDAIRDLAEELSEQQVELWVTSIQEQIQAPVAAYRETGDQPTRAFPDVATAVRAFQEHTSQAADEDPSERKEP